MTPAPAVAQASGTMPAKGALCTICASQLAMIPRRNDTMYRALSKRYRAFFCQECQISVCGTCDQGSRICPRCGSQLWMLREVDLPSLVPPETDSVGLEKAPQEVRDALNRLWRADDAAQAGTLVDQLDAATLEAIATHLDLSRLPTNPSVIQGFKHNGKDERFLRMLEAGLRLLATRPQEPATLKYWDALLKTMRKRVYGVRDSRAPLDDARDPKYLVGPVRQLLVQAGNQWLKQRKPLEALLCFQTVLAANPELSEVQYANAVAANNVVAQPNAAKLDRVRALRAFNAFLRSSAAQQDPKRFAMINSLRRQILGMKDHPKA